MTLSYLSHREIKTKKIPLTYKLAGFSLLVDVNGLEPLTLRTSSECSTS